MSHSYIRECVDEVYFLLERNKIREITIARTNTMKEKRLLYETPWEK